MPTHDSAATASPQPSRKTPAAFKSAARAAAEVQAYEAEIDRLVKSSRQDPDKILEALGCCEVEMRRGKGWCFNRPKPPAPVHEPLVYSLLCELLPEQVARTVPSDITGVSLLDGLLQKNRWREVVKTSAGAYDFAYLLAQLTASISWCNIDTAGSTQNKNDFPRALRLRVVPIITGVVNAWIAPRKLNAPLSPGTLLKELFGSAWYDLVLDFDERDFRTWDIRDTVSAANPSFLPGLVLEQVENVPIRLPPLDPL